MQEKPEKKFPIVEDPSKKTARSIKEILKSVFTGITDVVNNSVSGSSDPELTSIASPDNREQQKKRMVFFALNSDLLP